MHQLARAALFSVLYAFAFTLFPLRSAHALEALATFDAAAGQIPESLTTDREGDLFFSWASTSTIQKRTPDGTITTFGTLPIPVFTLGVKVGPDRCVYTVSTSLSATVGAFLWRICAPGQVEQVAALDPSGGPNDLAFDDEGNVFVTDPFLGQIYKVSRRGVVEIWLADPALRGNPAAPALDFHSVGVDGIAFDESERHLYVDNLDFGTILRIDVDHGRAGSLSLFASDPRLLGCDGIAFDRAGDLWVAVNAQDQLAKVDRRGNVTIVEEGGILDGPSSLVFGETERDRHTLYIANSAFLRAFGFQAGTPDPAILVLTR
jgi:sugar lactone lactonase YvrE